MPLVEMMLNILRFYAPMVLGFTYVVGYQRKKLDNLLKFFVISVHAYLLQQLIQSAFETKLISLIMVPLHIYMTLFHYAYSGVIYDIICAPLFGILLESYDQIVKGVERERTKSKVKDEFGEQYISQQGYIAGTLYDTFKPENIFLLN